MREIGERRLSGAVDGKGPKKNEMLDADVVKEDDAAVFLEHGEELLGRDAKPEDRRRRGVVQHQLFFQ